MVEVGGDPRAKSRLAWLAALALVGSLGGCTPSEQGGSGGNDAGDPAGGGSSKHDAGTKPDDKDACVDATTPDGGGEDASSDGRCMNACAKGATRCASSTSLEVCTVGAGGCTSFVASTCATGTVCERTRPAACVDPEWAEWPISNSAQDVANGAPNLQTLVDNADGTVTDVVTGLTWEQRFHQSVASSGETFCPTVMTGGYADWRQPTIIELVSIADFSIDLPSIDAAVFPLVTEPSLFFWSASRAQDFGLAPYIMSYGEFPGVEISGGFGVPGQPGTAIRCVR